MEKKKLFEILNTIADWIIRVILVNFLVIATSLLIVTIIPAITAGYRILSDALYQDERKIFKGFFTYFKEALLDKIILNIIVAIVLAVSIFNNRGYAKMIEAGPSIWLSIGYYATLILIIGTVMVTMYLPVVYSEKADKELSYISKMAFYLSGKYFLRTFLITLTLLIPYLMLTTPFTILLLVFCGASLPLLLNAMITKKARDYLKTIGGSND